MTNQHNTGYQVELKKYVNITRKARKECERRSLIWQWDEYGFEFQLLDAIPCSSPSALRNL